jgi:hypothetical protein
MTFRSDNSTGGILMSPNHIARRHRSLLILATLCLGAMAPTVFADGTPGALTSRPRPALPGVKPLEPGAEVRTKAGERRRVVLPDGAVLYVNANTIAKLQGPRSLALDAGEVYVEVAAGRDDRTPFVINAGGKAISGQGSSFTVRLAKDGPAIAVTRGQVAIAGRAEAIHAGQQLGAGAAMTEPTRASHALAWLRDLMCAAEAPLLPANDHAGGALVAIDPNGQEAHLTLRRYHIDVHIEDGFARTTIDQTYFNQHGTQLEGTFYFPLPPDASLSRLAMYVNGVLMEGGMAERDHARNVYETIRYARRDPALLEWVDGSTFRMRVFPLEPRQEKRIVLSYSQRLGALYGRMTYRFPAGHTLQKVRDWSLYARIKDGAGWSWDSLSHVLQSQQERKDLLLFGLTQDAATNRDVVLSIADPRRSDPLDEVVQFATAEHEGARYLMARVRPRLTTKMLNRRRDWVFLVETSGDRDPLLARTQIEVLRHLLTYAEPTDTFSVLAAGTRVRPLAAQPMPVTPENVAAAVAALEQAHLIGALDLGLALSEAAKLLKQVPAPHLVHLGSGIAAMGERRDDVLAKRLPDGATYIGIGVGRRWNRALMKAAAERTGGHFTQINPDEPIGWRSFELLATINTRRLMDVEIRDTAGKVKFLALSQAIAQGEEIVAITRVTGDDPLPKSVTITAKLNGNSFERVLPVKYGRQSAGYLPRTWAKLEIDRLLAEDAVKHKDAIVALSKAMYVITPYTSLLVLENEDQYTQYKVDRGRKDHWALYPLPATIPVIVEPDPDAAALKAGKLPANTVLQTIATRSRSPGAGNASVRHANGVFDTNMFAISGEKEKAVPPSAERFRVGAGFNTDNGLVGSVSHGRPPGASAPPVLDAFAMPQVTGVTISPAPVRFPMGEGMGAGPPPPPPRDVPSRMPAEMLRRLETRKGKFDLDMYIRANTNLGIPRQSTVPRPAASIELNPDKIPANMAIQMLDMRIDQDEVAKALQVIEPVGVGHRNLVPLSRYQLTRTGAAAKAGRNTDNDSLFLRLIAELEAMPSSGSLYQRPTYQPDASVFHDLIAYAPGLNTSTADVLGVLDGEALPGAWNKPGNIEPAARTLIDNARRAGWQMLTLPAEDGQPRVAIHFDGQGKFAYERVLPFGLRERVVCDGQSLTHLYPQLALAARRDATRFHRADLAGMVPWFVPAADELARGADVKLVAPRTVAIVPHGTAALPKDSAYQVVHLIFAEDGRVAARRIVKMPGNETVSTLTLSADGVATRTDGQGKELTVQKGELRVGAAPSLIADTKGLLVVPLPYRTAAHVRASLKLQKKSDPELTLKEALPVFLAYIAEGNGNASQNLFNQVFYAREQRQLGYYVLLAACGVNLDSDHGNVLAEHGDSPLAQYLALHTSPVLRKHASQWAVASASWQDAFLQHLAVTHALLQRWENDRLLKGDPARAQAEIRRALEYVRSHRDSLFGWALLCRVQDRAEKDTALHGQLAELWPRFAHTPGLAYGARYEQARSLWRAGKKAAAAEQFRAQHESAINDGALPAIDADLREALLASGGWGPLLRQTADRLVAQKQRAAVLALARQCWDLDDQPLAGELLAAALDGIADPAERTAPALAGFAFLRETGQLAEADRLLQSLLADGKLARHSLLWRLGHGLAQHRDMPARAVECLEKALALEAEQPPEVIDLQGLRADYGALLEHYQGLADAMVALKLTPPPDFLSRVIRGADRWRAVDNDATAACQAAAKVLERLGERELAWDYLTTPVALRRNEAAPWSNLAATLSKQADLELADRAYRAAAEAEPTDPQLLWDRAQNLKQLGKHQAAQQLVRRIATGSWQPRFQGLQAQARHLLKED